MRSKSSVFFRDRLQSTHRLLNWCQFEGSGSFSRLLNLLFTIKSINIKLFWLFKIKIVKKNTLLSHVASNSKLNPHVFSSTKNFVSKSTQIPVDITYEFIIEWWWSSVVRNRDTHSWQYILDDWNFLDISLTVVQQGGESENDRKLPKRSRRRGANSGGALTCEFHIGDFSDTRARWLENTHHPNKASRYNVYGCD